MYRENSGTLALLGGMMRIDRKTLRKIISLGPVLPLEALKADIIPHFQDMPVGRKRKRKPTIRRKVAPRYGKSDKR